MPNTSIEQELNERHAAAQAAFARRDIDAYKAIFSPSLAYRQINGQVIDRGRLMRNVASQFRRLSAAQSSFVRERLNAAGGEAAETLTQSASLEATAFGFVHRRWRLHRRGDYAWTKLDGVWVIERVEIVSEKLSPDGWRFGF